MTARALDPAEVRELEPSLGENILGAVYYPHEATPSREASSMPSAGPQPKRARSSGPASTCAPCARQNGQVLLDTSDGDLRSQTVVLAAAPGRPGWPSARRLPAA